MFVGVEYNNDTRMPRTEIVQFVYENLARKWLNEWDYSTYAFPAAATHDIPVSQQNWARRTRAVYELPPYYHLPETKVREEVKRSSMTSYPRTHDDVAHTYYLCDCIREIHHATERLYHSGPRVNS